MTRGRDILRQRHQSLQFEIHNVSVSRKDATFLIHFHGKFCHDKSNNISLCFLIIISLSNILPVAHHIINVWTVELSRGFAMTVYGELVCVVCCLCELCKNTDKIRAYRYLCTLWTLMCMSLNLNKSNILLFQPFICRFDEARQLCDLPESTNCVVTTVTPPTPPTTPPGTIPTVPTERPVKK